MTRYNVTVTRPMTGTRTYVLTVQELMGFWVRRWAPTADDSGADGYTVTIAPRN